MRVDVGSEVGSYVGSYVGSIVGSMVDSEVGLGSVGEDDVGRFDGILLGLFDGTVEGVPVTV